MADSANPFGDAEAWTTSTDTYLSIGNHKVKIELAEDDSSKKDQAGARTSESKPQIKLQFGNSQGTKMDWCPYSEDFLDRVVALFDCAGIERPGDGEFDMGDHMRLTKACIDRLVGHEIGIVIREDEYQGKTREKVKGYVKAEQISDTQPNIPPSNVTGAHAGQTTPANPDSDPVPF